jgi:cytochrome c556
MKKITALVLATAAMFPVFAQQEVDFIASSHEAIEHRRAAFKQMQQNFKRVADMAGGKADFDAKVAAESAQKAADLIKTPWTGFGPGTQGGHSKASIWKEKEEFDKLAANSQDALDKLAVAAKSGKLEDIQAAIRPAGGTCKACHDSYKD